MEANEKNYSLIVTIVNKGTTDLALNAARRAGSSPNTCRIPLGCS